MRAGAAVAAPIEAYVHGTSGRARTGRPSSSPTDPTSRCCADSPSSPPRTKPQGALVPTASPSSTDRPPATRSSRPCRCPPTRACSPARRPGPKPRRSPRTGGRERAPARRRRLPRRGPAADRQGHRRRAAAVARSSTSRTPPRCRSSEIDACIADNLTDDRVFGVIIHAAVDAFYDAERLAALAAEIDSATTGRPCWSAGAPTSLARRLATPTRSCSPTWRAGRSSSGSARAPRTGAADNAGEDQLRKYKRGFFVEWRMADRHKRTLFDRIDFVLDANAIGPPSRPRRPG